MKKFLTLAAVAVLVLGASSAVFANVCALDQTPSATLLFPFVTYDYNAGDQGETTLFAVTNVSNEAQIVHFVLWTDYSLHVLDWNVVLSGYDVTTMNIRDLLAYGDLPNTGIWAPGDSGEVVKSTVDGGTVYEDGPVTSPNTIAVLPDPDGTATLADRCPTDAVAYPDYAPLSSTLLARMQQFLQASQTSFRAEVSCDTGDIEPLNNYWFSDRTTADPTHMYVTADVVWTCNRLFPDADQPYWNNVLPDPPTLAEVNTGPQAMYDNVLIGDIFYVDPGKNLSEAMPAVHLEADMYLGRVATPNPFDGDPQSFYHQYIEALSPSTPAYQPTYGDYREPLPSAWGFRWINDGSMTTSLRVFERASAELVFQGQSPGMLTDMLFLDADQNLWAGTGAPEPPAYMLAWDCQAYTYYAWDEDENSITVIPSGGPSPPPGGQAPPGINLLPLETQEVDISQFNLPEAGSGWMMLVFPWSNTDQDDVYQTYVSVRYGAYGHYSAAVQAAVLGNYSCFADQVLPNLGVNYPYILTPAQ